MQKRTEDFYSRIPNDFFYGKNIIKNTNKNILMVYDLLYISKGVNNISTLSIEYIVEHCGHKPNRNRGKSNDTIKECLYYLESYEIIKVSYGSIENPSKNLIGLEMINDLSKGYVELKRSEITKISKSNKNVDLHRLLILYMYLKSRMHRRASGDDMVKSGGIPETCYPTYNNIEDDIGLTSATINKYLDELERLDLIRYDNSGLWFNPKDVTDGDKIKFMESGNIYTLFSGSEKECKHRLKEAKKNQILYYESIGRVFKKDI